VTEESSAGAPGPGAQIREPVPVRPPTAPWLRASNPWVRIAGVAVAVAALASVLVTVVHSGSSQPVYSSLPAPCALVSPATVAKYLPNPTRSPESMFASSSYQAGSCKWASSTGGDDRTLVAQVFVFDSSSSVAAARQAYDSSLSAFGCHCQAVTVSTQPVNGLGDQAAVFHIADGPAATIAAAPNAAFPGTSLLVRSSNAEIALTYDVTVGTTGTALTTGTPPLTGMISMAQDILDGLAQPSAVASVPVSPEPHYTGSPDPCSLITAATLATYAPGATAQRSGSSSCSWASKIMLTLSSFADAASARQNFDLNSQANSRTITGETVTGSVWMPDLGEEAAAIFQTRSASGQGVAMIVWSGNVEISLWYAGSGSPSSASPSSAPATPPVRATLLAGGIAMARDVLAGLAPS
jgi:hypothetical protein